MILCSPSALILTSTLKREFGANWLKRSDLFLIRVPNRSLFQNRERSDRKTIGVGFFSKAP